MDEVVGEDEDESGVEGEDEGEGISVPISTLPSLQTYVPAPSLPPRRRRRRRQSCSPRPCPSSTSSGPLHSSGHSRPDPYPVVVSAPRIAPQETPAKRGRRSSGAGSTLDLNKMTHFHSDVKDLGSVPPVWMWALLRKKSLVPIGDALITVLSSKSNLPLKQIVHYLTGPPARARPIGEGGEGGFLGRMPPSESC